MVYGYEVDGNEVSRAEEYVQPLNFERFPDINGMRQAVASYFNCPSWNVAIYVETYGEFVHLLSQKARTRLLLQPNGEKFIVVVFPVMMGKTAQEMVNYFTELLEFVRFE